MATAFYIAVDASHWSSACHDLAPETAAKLVQSAGKACPAALEEEDLPDAGPVEGIEAFGTMAQVHFGQDTVFVSRFEDGWKVMAAACSPVPSRPYDCRLEG